MKKRKQKSLSAATTTNTSATTTAALKAQIREHRVFFDKLVELIPAKFYLSNDDDSKPWYQGLSKVARASLKQQTRENIKLARRNRLDPEKASQSSTLHLLEKQNHGGEDVAEVPANPISFDENLISNGDNSVGSGGDGRSVTYEELREKLRKKIESLRGNRGGVSGERKIERKGNPENKRKRDDGEGGKSVEEEKVKVGEKVEDVIEFGKVKIGDDEKGGKKKKRKMSKVKELERAKRLQEVKKENPFVAERESWKTAESRALGKKVHDDPRLLKESLKKEKKRKEKNAEKWKERTERTEKMKEERQQKRRNNIAERARDKKARKIAKREKKLMRPGFEGRKEDYITKD